MTAPRPLAEIVAEGERALAKYDEIGPAKRTLYPVMMCDADVVRRLLAAVKAGMEMRKREGCNCAECSYPCRPCTEAFAAWNAAAGGKP